MPGSLRGLAAMLSILLAILAAVGIWYSQQQNIPLAIALAALPAFLMEAGMYAASGTLQVRKRLERFAPVSLAAGMALSGLIPYVLYSLGTATLSGRSLAILTTLVLVSSFYYVLMPKRPASDLLFLVILAAPIVTDLFKTLYTTVTPRLPASILGVLMWYRMGMLGVLCLRRMEGIGLGFIPERRDWLVGLRNFAIFVPIGFIPGIAMGFLRPHQVTPSWKLLTTVVLTFIGVLWVLALAEEFFFRGLLQQLVTLKTGSEVAGLAIASTIFGLAHLGFRDFPNWQFALLAACAGWFYGRAYAQTKAIRAPMVTHALVVTTWRVFLY